jgi:acyl carrier protein phosphodiesterase
LNYLAHLFIGSGRSPRFLAGNLAGDFLRGSIPPSMDAEVAAGVRLHRAVDAFTDSHPVVGVARRLFVPELRHHARIALDVVLDHFLACHFDDFSPVPLDRFAVETYEQLRSVRELVPASCARVIEKMSEGDWLTSYRELDSIERALRYLSARLARPVQLTRAMKVVGEHREELDEAFLEFFPQLMAMRPATA